MSYTPDLPLPFPISQRHSEPSNPIFPMDASNSTSTATSKSALDAGRTFQPSQSTLKEPDLEAQPTHKGAKRKPPFLARLPTWVSFWLGYRKVQPPPEKNHIVWTWSFIGAFACISIIQALFGNVDVFVEKGVPSIGATAVLLYGAIESPLSQPRPVIGGHLVGATTGLVVTKLFLLLPTQERYDELSWLAGSLCCALALVFMQMTGTMHPPAGATALLAAVSPEIRDLGWLYIPIVLLASTIALVVALFSNNMQRRYPTFWWTPPPTTAPSFFPTLQLTRTLTKTWTWTSKHRTLFRGLGRKRGGAKKGGNQHEDKDWHYSIKNYSKVFGTGRAGSIRLPSRSGSRSRESSRSRHGPGTPRTPVAPGTPNAHSGGNASPGFNSALTSSFATPYASQPGTPATLSPSASAAVSRVQSTDDMHVVFQVQPMHHHLHGSGHQQTHRQHHHHHHSSQNVNYLRYLAMKREGTLSGSGQGTPSVSSSAGSSRRVSVDGESYHYDSVRGRSVGNVSAGQPDPQHDSKEHAQQLIEAVTTAMREREEKDRADGVDENEEEWEDVNEEAEVDLGEDVIVVRRPKVPPLADDKV